MGSNTKNKWIVSELNETAGCPAGVWRIGRLLGVENTHTSGVRSCVSAEETRIVSVRTNISKGWEKRQRKLSMGSVQTNPRELAGSWRGNGKDLTESGDIVPGFLTNTKGSYIFMMGSSKTPERNILWPNNLKESFSTMAWLTSWANVGCFFAVAGSAVHWRMLHSIPNLLSTRDQKPPPGLWQRKTPQTLPNAPEERIRLKCPRWKWFP